MKKLNNDIETETNMIIYKTTNLINGKIYIGQDSHNNTKYLGSGTLIRKAIKQYGTDMFYKEVLEYCNTKKLLNEREIYWINALNSIDPNIGYNRHRGIRGKDTYGTRLMNDGHKHYYIHADDIDNKLTNGFVFGPLLSVIEKCKLASSGSNNPNYGNTGIKNVRFGTVHTEYTKNLIRLSQIGKYVSEETKQKQSVVKSGENNPMYNRKQKRTVCEYCKSNIAVNIYSRYHGNKCKQNKES